MSAESHVRELLRLNLLRQLAAATPHSLPVSALIVGARLEAHTVDEKAIEAECLYLVDKGLAYVEGKLLSPENKRWRITAAGRDAIAEAGL